jgi:hypothetical protein
MNKKLLSLVSVLMVTGAASAAIIPSEISTFSWDGPMETYGLINILNAKVADFSDFELSDLETFTATKADVWLIKEVAGNKDYNSFGWYDVSDPSDLKEIFPGVENAPSNKSLVFYPTTEVGFYLETIDRTFYTQNSLNLGGKGQVAVFRNTKNANDFILAWEDITRTKDDNSEHKDITQYGDSDFNDLIVRIQVSVPEPATLGFLGLSLLSLSGISLIRRKRN